MPHIWWPQYFKCYPVGGKLGVTSDMAKHCHIFGGFNKSNFPCGLQLCGIFKHCVVFSNRAKYWVRGLQSCGIFKHCRVGAFKLNSLNFSPLLAILWYLQKSKALGGFDNLSFAPWPAILWYFSNSAKYLVASTNKKFYPFLTILLYFQILPHIERLQYIGWLRFYRVFVEFYRGFTGFCRVA